MGKRRLGGSLFKAARTTTTLEALLSGKPKRIGRRGKNIGLGRLFARGGFWNWLWGGGKR